MKQRPNVRSLRLGVGLLLVAALVLSLLPSPSVFADVNTNQLTNKDLVSAGGEDGAVSLHLKYLNVAQVTENRMAAYYPGNNDSANGRAIRITAGQAGRVCNLYRSVVRANDELRIRIRIAGNVSQTYSIPILQVCDTNRFYGHDFAFPNGRLQPDPSGYYRAQILVFLHTNGPSQPDLEGYDLNYNVRLVGTGSSATSGAKLALQANDDSSQFGMRSAYMGQVSRAANRRVKIAVPFGYPCGERITDPQRVVRLYDADRAFGETYMWVTKGGNTPLDRGEYAAPSRMGTFDNATKRWQVGGSNNTENHVSIVSAVPGESYKLHILNTGKDGNRDSNLNPHNNTLSVAIPTDSIYADVDCDFGLVPHVTVSPPAYVATPTLNVNGWIETRGSGTPSGNHPWEIYVVKYDNTPDTGMRGRDANNDACLRPSPTNQIGGSCQLYRPVMYPASDNSVSTYTGSSPDPVGTFTCFFVRILDPTDAVDDNNDWRYSNMQCSVAGELPRVQIEGHDARILGMTSTSYITVEGETYGSWGEYGVFSGLDNWYTASGKGLAGGAGSNSQANWSDLTFSNTPSGQFGNYAGIVDGFDENDYVVTQSRPDGYTFDGPGNSPINYGPNTREVIRVNGTAYINTDLRYRANGGGYANYTEIPRVIIIADNIVIDGDVDRIDPWLVALEDPVSGAGGNISTCAQATSPEGLFLAFDEVTLTTGICNNQLEFNSPVYASHVYLYRTFGNYNNQPAEIFRLRGDVFLSAIAGSNTNPVATTDVITELPPRF